MRENIAIIGGGIGGLCTAIALQKLGYQVTVFEKHSATRRVGSGIVLGSNAMVSLDFLGVGSLVRQIGCEKQSFTIYSEKGKELTRLLHKGKKLSNYTFVLRSELMDILTSAIQGDTIVYNKKLTNFEQDSDGITLFFEDDTSYRVDYMIASDGIHSTIRKLLLPNKKLRFAGYSCWRGIAEKCPDYIERKYTETWGPRGRIGIVPLKDNRMYWYAFKNCQAGDEEFKKWKTDDLVYNFIDYHTPIPNLIDRTKNNNIIQHDIYDLEPIYQFMFNRVLLIADAAHATTPNMGQGACQAIEDALFLALCLNETQNVNHAFIEYEGQRLDRTRKVVQDSWLLGKVAQLEVPLLCSIRNKMIELAPNKIHDKKLKDILEVHTYMN